tara:strand:+ start:1824 stop:1952 length:129 start_codon:yes stop_codon:yes gene_type:complete
MSGGAAWVDLGELAAEGDGKVGQVFGGVGVDLALLEGGVYVG